MSDESQIQSFGEQPQANSPTNDMAANKPSTPEETAYDVILSHRRLRVNSVQVLQKMQILKDGRAMMDIPLCRMIGLQVVHSTLTVDIEKLKADFVHGYRPRAAVFYVSTTNFQGSERKVMQEEHSSWDRH